MSFVLVNPGSGPAEDATLAVAWKLIGEFVGELESLGVQVATIVRKPDGDYGEGRYLFGLHCVGNKQFEIQMPGSENVRPADPTMYPLRLYVDDSSWYWGIAVSIVAGNVKDGDGG